MAAPAATLKPRSSAASRPPTRRISSGQFAFLRAVLQGMTLRDAADRFRAQLATSPRAAVEPDDVTALSGLGYGDLLPANH